MKIISYYNIGKFVSPKVLYTKEDLYKSGTEYVVVNADPSCNNLFSGIREAGGASDHMSVFVPDRMPDCYLGEVVYSYIADIPGIEHKIGYISPSGVEKTTYAFSRGQLYYGYMDIDEVGVWKVGVSIGAGKFVTNSMSTFTALPSCKSKWTLTYFNKYGLISTENRFVKVTETVDAVADSVIIDGYFYPGMSNRKDVATLKLVSAPLTVEDRDLMIGLGRRPIVVGPIDYAPLIDTFSGNAMASKVGITLDNEVSPITLELKGKFDYE